MITNRLSNEFVNLIVILHESKHRYFLNPLEKGNIFAGLKSPEVIQELTNLGFSKIKENVYTKCQIIIHLKENLIEFETAYGFILKAFTQNTWAFMRDEHKDKAWAMAMEVGNVYRESISRPNVVNIPKDGRNEN